MTNKTETSGQSFEVGQFAPGIFSVAFGTGNAIAINPDGSLAAPAGSISGLATRPAKAGSDPFMIILATVEYYAKNRRAIAGS